MVDYESPEYVLEGIRGRVDEMLYEIRRDLMEEAQRIEGDATNWIDSLARKMGELQKAMRELDSVVDQMRKQYHDSEEEHHKFEGEVRERLAKLEALSFMGSLGKLFDKAQKAGMGPEEVFEEVLRILVKVKGRRIAT